ncbi:MAG TPA: hypothetical protein VIE65_07775 [Methylobacter sp.]|jgi:hypothetical protein
MDKQDGVKNKAAWFSGGQSIAQHMNKIGKINSVCTEPTLFRVHEMFAATRGGNMPPQKLIEFLSNVEDAQNHAD